jgi:hypothetical protein
MVFGGKTKIIQNLIKFKYDSKFVFYLKNFILQVRTCGTIKEARGKK